jgi:hypothetical protein
MLNRKTNIIAELCKVFARLIFLCSIIFWAQAAKAAPPPCTPDFSGPFCAKPATGYSRNYEPPWDAPTCKNSKKNLTGGDCETSCDGLWWPKCKPGFHSPGGMLCNFCAPDCPVGMTDSGTLCKR